MNDPVSAAPRRETLYLFSFEELPSQGIHPLEFAFFELQGSSGRIYWRSSP